MTPKGTPRPKKIERGKNGEKPIVGHSVIYRRYERKRIVAVVREVEKGLWIVHFVDEHPPVDRRVKWNALAKDWVYQPSAVDQVSNRPGWFHES